jgi:hypothetical protein
MMCDCDQVSGHSRWINGYFILKTSNKIKTIIFSTAQSNIILKFQNFIYVKSENALATVHFNDINTESFLTLLLVHNSALHINWCITWCKINMNFADESACLKADNVWNGLLDSIMFHSKQWCSCMGVCLQFVSSGQQSSLPLANCSQLQLVSSVIHQDVIYFRTTCHLCEIWIY